MANQAPYVLNLALDYSSKAFGLDSRLLYNIAGKRLVQVGAFGVDDSWAHPRHRLDFVAAKKLGEHFKLKVSATNLIDSERVVTIGKEDREELTRSRYRDGRTFGLGVSYSH